MTTLIFTLHIFSCIFLILIVLLQTGKGATMGASLGGGGSQALFGSAGPATILNKITTGIAILFMITSLTLAYSSGHKTENTIMPETRAPITAPAEQPASQNGDAENTQK
ncbi:MAG: preprotein translocase subunit SecG [Desulfobacteraceae bacterium]